ncbi:hypothetical protein AUEXF2481DRAFT_190984 [Aureobasidium subglaciale EXF-2481]|uniref:Uncharacterized protein n=1 Tax=Aureobasidium subglaciale (strain EXF-2481) TaxID=1043005 RepID=A0A074YPI7_AURSE|nr:uncharacterized protein AUEXF2481DRAFT_190984 [Aureobasidium subglaciale EXF-2481]KAI5204682.1 hypothetical protein E4T38_04644 [Aureobasidium subglaciale]KAI5223765.1 hypothetical protein E4T40_04420 [Aureobasidium subglaciale]KAI5227177.1 hypothetical protein E4T41_04453 [Aureobasidium subglaciale]KAI5262602.1 hypothetical protein E4T46_04339 [Aureobasidium subglaciale]KEQ99693.1 hypothetical protein AUEXF2481DRAFT_190984 [Aureobasidium subglaciale EXF-2481]
MHGEVLHHLVRRGYEAMSDSESRQTMVAEVSAAQMLPLILTVLLFSFIVASVHYTLGGVVASLAMIEDHQTAVVETRILAVDGKQDSDAPLDKARLIDEEVMVVKQTPLTSSIRNTLKHLTTIGGFRARWRGLGSALIYDVVRSLTVGFITMFVAAFTGLPVVARVFANIAANVLCARIHMVWTHAVISEPSTLTWSQRLGQTDRNMWRALALPALVHSVAELATYGLPVAMFLFVGPDVTTGDGDMDNQHLLARGAMSLLAFVMLNILILLPATVTRTRIEASFLPEESNTIVPFDRTFNGSVNMLALDTRAARKSLFIEAWRSFDMASRIRLVKFFVKQAAIELFFTITAFIAVGAQAVALGLTASAIDSVGDGVVVSMDGM